MKAVSPVGFLFRRIPKLAIAASVEPAPHWPVSGQPNLWAVNIDPKAAAETYKKRILDDARAHAQAGAFGVVLEGISEPLGREITAALPIPTIGIGASPACDGQILVTEDILGLSGDRIPKFARRFADAGQVIRQAAEDYAQSVREETFPTLAHCFGVRADR